MFCLFNIHSIKAEVLRIRENCHTYKNRLDKKDRKEVRYLFQEVENCFPEFSAAGFLYIDGRKTFLSLFANIATYFLAIVEFNKIYSEKK